MSDCSDSEEDALCKILLVWGLSNQNKIASRVPEQMVQFCYYFVVFREKHLAIPKSMGDRLPVEKLRELIHWLNSEIEKVHGPRLAAR